MIDTLSTLANHVANTLPDSISARKEVLIALANVITSSHPAFKFVSAQLAAIETVERLQRELPLQFKPKTPAQTGDGDGHNS